VRMPFWTSLSNRASDDWAAALAQKVTEASAPIVVHLILLFFIGLLGWFERRLGVIGDKPKARLLQSCNKADWQVARRNSTDWSVGERQGV